MCKACSSRGVWGHASPPGNFGCPEIESGGFWQLADYPTLVFRIRAFLNLVIVNWNKYHSYKVIMTPLYETLIRVSFRGGGEGHLPHLKAWMSRDVGILQLVM